jgi:type II secretory pathway pseudopilin PulG
MTRSTAGHDGFSLIEFLVSVVVTLFLMGAVFHVLGKYQRTYQTEQVTTDMRQGARSAMELLSQEVGQAGYLGFTTTSLNADVTGAAIAQTVPLASTANIFNGEILMVDAGVAQELVTVTDLTGTTVSGVFRNSHSKDAPVNAVGVFSQGVLPPPSSTANVLQLFGDVNADGTLRYVEYRYDSAAGTLSRSITPIDAAVQETPRVLLRDLQPNANGTAFFQYRTQAVPGGNCVIEVTVTATTRTSSPDPESKQYRSMTSSLVLSPRNVLVARDLAVAGAMLRLQPAPPGLPIPTP